MKSLCVVHNDHFQHCFLTPHPYSNFSKKDWCEVTGQVLCAAILTELYLLNGTGAASGSTDLLPAPSPSTNWTASLLTDSGRDSDLIYRFDGRQAANVPDHVVPQNLTDQFTIATWMKHGPSPGLRAEKETLLCNSDKTGEETIALKSTFFSVYI